MDNIVCKSITALLGLGNRLCANLNLTYALTIAYSMLYLMHTDKGDNEMQQDEYQGDEPQIEQEQKEYEERMWELRGEEE